MLFLLLSNAQTSHTLKIDHKSTFTDGFLASNGEIIITGESESQYNGFTNYNYYLTSIDSNGVKTNQTRNGNRIFSIFEGKDGLIYNAYNELLNCINCWTIMYSIQLESYDLQLNPNYLSFENSFETDPYYGQTIQNGNAHTLSHQILFRDTAIYLVNNEGNVDASYSNTLNIHQSLPFQTNEILFETIDQKVYIGDTTIFIFDSLVGYRLSGVSNDNGYLLKDSANHLYAWFDLNHQIQQSYPADSIVDVAFRYGKFFWLKKSGSSMYELITTDSAFNTIATESFNSPNQVTYQKIFPFSNHFLLVGNENNGFSTNVYTAKRNYQSGINADTELDLSIDEILVVDNYLVLDSIQTGASTYDYYQSEIVQLAAVITNASPSQSLYSCYLNAGVNYYHSYGYGCPNYEDNKTHVMEGLPPGQSDTVLFDPIYLRYSGYNELRDICVWGDSPNFNFDLDLQNNLLCSQYLYTSIPETSFSFDVFPNPSDGIIHINCSTRKPKTVTIYNLAGKVMLKTTLSNEIDLSALDSGIYLIQVSDQSTSATRKIIIL